MRPSNPKFRRPNMKFWEGVIRLLMSSGSIYIAGISARGSNDL